MLRLIYAFRSKCPLGKIKAIYEAGGDRYYTAALHTSYEYTTYAMFDSVIVRLKLTSLKTLKETYTSETLGKTVSNIQ